MKPDRLPQRQKHGGTIRRLRADGAGEGIIDFSASMNPYPPTVHWKPELCDLREYPDDTYMELKEAIGSAFSRDPAEVTVGNGSIELIRIYAQIFLSPGSSAYIESPTFGEYAQSVLIAGGRLAEEPEDATVRYLCNPNNPTGELLVREEVQQILHSCKETGSRLFLDEAFIDLADPRESMADHRDSDLFILRSITKAFSVPGIRFGFGFSDPDTIEAIETVRPPWTVNRYAEAYAIEALRHLPDLLHSRQMIADERRFLTESITSLGLFCHPSQVNYLLIDTGRDAGALQHALLRQGILVRDCSSFGLPQAIRVAVRTHEENTMLIEALSACMH